MDLKNKRILVVGLGKSGAAAAAFLKSRGAEVTVTDTAPEPDIAAAARDMRAMGIAVESGGHHMRSFETADLVVLSPGVPHTIDPVLRAADRGIPVIGEIELASRFITEPMVAVTGTNGKTTVTLLLGEMLRQSGRRVFVGGNIGAPLIDYVREKQHADLLVVEVSSFQLDTIETFKPMVGVLLNITEDHLDRYPDFDVYARSKARLFENQTPDDTAVLNASDPMVRSVCRHIAARKLWVSSRPDADIASAGAILNGSRILCRRQETGEIPFDLSGVKFSGRHNLENAGAACLAALAAGGTVKGIQTALNHFTMPGHRLELVDTIQGVSYYNDSKATNVNAVHRALESFTDPVVLIMGGRDKGSNFRILEACIRNHVKKLILMGEATDVIASALGNATEIETVSSMEEAVAAAAKSALPGETVLLSPGCASFDMFTDYARRGEAFKKAVNRLK